MSDITCFVEGVAFPFVSMEDVKDFFGLDEIDQADFVAIDGKHVCVDPYAEDIHDKRVLMWADTAEALERDYKEACDEI